MKNTISLTPHAKLRMAQRGITEQMIADTIEYGHSVRKQQISYYIMLSKCIPDGLPPAYIGRLKNCVVLVNWLGEVLTVYRNAKGLKAILRKSDYRGGRIIDAEAEFRLKSKIVQRDVPHESVSIETLISVPETIRFGALAEERMTEYNLSLEDIVLVLKHGRRRRTVKNCQQLLMNGCGAMLQYPVELRQRINGLQLVLTPCGKIIKIKYLHSFRFNELEVLSVAPFQIAA